MRSNSDERLIRKAMRDGDRRRKNATQKLINIYEQRAIRRLRGKVRWEGTLARNRRGRVPSKPDRLIGN